MEVDKLVRELARLRSDNRALVDENERLRRERGRAIMPASESLYRSVVAAMHEGVVVQDVAGTILACNDAAEHILGLTADQMSGRTSYDPRWRSIRADGSPFPGEQHPALITLRTGEACRDVVMGVQKPTGELRWIEINSEPVPAADGGRPGVCTTFNDVTEHRRVLAELRASDERLRFALRSARAGVWEWDLVAERVVWSDTTEELFGLPPHSFGGRYETYLEMVHPADRARVQIEVEAAIAGVPDGERFVVRHRILRGREERWLDVHARVFRDVDGRPVRMAGVAVDITDARRLELRTRQGQRMEAIGRLAGGVAHDFNNVLTVILSAVDLARRRRGADVEGELETIRDAAARAARLTRQLLAFASRQAIGASTIDLGALIRDLERLIGHLIGERIALTVDIAPGRWLVHADAGQLEQVLMNLVANARDAIAGVGTVRIAVGASPGGDDEVAVAVEDDGCGMAADTLEHLFEPFFTTKTSGTGLGLATSYGIIEQHGGRIEVDSELGRGTRIEVRLPRAPAAVAARAAVAERFAPRARGTETLLLVEDDPMVRRVAERVLTEQGYRVLIATDGVAGLEVARAHLEQLDLVLTDAVMPRLGGGALARELRALRPDLPVLLMSGYDRDEPSGGDPGGLPRLQKPYTPEQLTARVRELLGGGAQRPAGMVGVAGPSLH